MSILDTFDPFDQATVTELVRAAVDRVLGPQDRIAANFMPLQPTRLEKIAKGKVKLKAIGKSRGLIADDATPPIYRPELRLTEEAFSLLRISEMTPVEESLMREIRNNGTDLASVETRTRAVIDLITRGKALGIREENLSDYLVMQSMITGLTPVKFANPPAPGDTSQEWAIDHEFLSTHIQQVSTSFDDLTNGNPITFLRAAQALLRRDAGDWGIHFWLSSEVFDYILNSKQVKDSLTINVGAQIIPQEEHIKRLLYAPDRVQFHIVDEGWYEEAAEFNVELDIDKTRWLPKDRMIITTEDPFRGERIAQMWDGMVPKQTDWDKYDYFGPGPQSYVQLIGENLTLMMRRECRRMPVVNKPECVISAKVVLP